MIWVESRASVRSRDETGEIVAVQGMIRDVTEQRRARDALRESEERFRSIAENATDVIFRRPPDLEIPFDYVSPAIFPMTGYTPEELCSTPGILATLVHPEDIPLLAHIAETEEFSRAGPDPVDPQGRGDDLDGGARRDQLRRAREARGCPGGRPRRHGARPLRSRALRNSEERFRNVTEQSFDAVTIVDETRGLPLPERRR